MGYHITANFPVNQDDIEDFICKNNINKQDSKQSKIIIDYYKTQNPNMAELQIYYYWSQTEYMHVFYDFYGTNFIRDDERFTDEAFQQQLAEKYGRDFPRCLIHLNYHLHTGEDAVEIAEALMFFFNDDNDDDDEDGDDNNGLICFAKWLLRTSNNGATYDLSY